MRAHFELIHGLLVDVRRTVHRETLDAGRERDGPHNLRTRATGRVDDTTDGLIQHTMIVCLEADADSLLLHFVFSFCSFSFDSPKNLLPRLVPLLPGLPRLRNPRSGTLVPLAQEALCGASLATEFRLSHLLKKRIAHGCIRNRERELNGHDATGFSRPYRDHFFRRLRYSISKVTTPRNGVFSVFYRPSGLISKLEDWPTRFV